MIKIINNAISLDEVNELLHYMSYEDHRSDKRPDVFSKHPRWDIDHWPQHIIKRILDENLDYQYTVEEVLFNRSKITFRLHADTGFSEKERNGNVILIPLEYYGKASTVFFNNFWYGNSTKFSKRELQPFCYNLKNKHGKWEIIDDIRILLDQCINDPKSVVDFEVNEQLINNIKLAINARENKGFTYVDGRCYDYSEIENYDPELKFDEKLHQQLLSHLPIETFHGLTICKVFEWKIRDVVIFERTRIHSAGTGHTEKTGLTIFTSKE